MLGKNKLALSICLVFFIAYLILGLVKHAHFLSGYDLAVVDQVIWKYTQLKAPITTLHAFPFTPLFTDHVEFIYVLLSPFYLIHNAASTLIVLQAFFLCLSGLPIYLIAKQNKLPTLLSLALLVSYLSFYGIQNALWSDAHSLVFGASFLAWLVYFISSKHTIGIFVSLALALLCKEDIGLLTFCIGLVFFILTRSRIHLLIMVISSLYVSSIFFVYFPYFTQDGYRFAAEGGLLSDLSVSYLYDTPEKLQVYFYSLGWFGFLPLAAPVYLIPAFVDVSHYFVLGHAVVTSAQSIFMHYRVTLALLLIWPTIIVLSSLLKSKYKKYANEYTLTAYILGFALVFQYLSHSPLSYLAKKWFWTTPTAVQDIKTVLKDLPKDASIISQNNISPHIGHRDLIFTLWPMKKEFKKDSPCGKPICDWARWAGNPEYMIVDTSADWDIRHFLANREDYIAGLKNMEKAGLIKRYKQSNNTVLYKIRKNE